MNERKHVKHKYDVIITQVRGKTECCTSKKENCFFNSKIGLKVQASPLLQDNWLLQVGRDIRRFLVQPPDQSRTRYEVLHTALLFLCLHD